MPVNPGGHQCYVPNPVLSDFISQSDLFQRICTHTYPIQMIPIDITSVNFILTFTSGLLVNVIFGFQKVFFIIAVNETKVHSHFKVPNFLLFFSIFSLSLRFFLFLLFYHLLKFIFEVSRKKGEKRKFSILFYLQKRHLLLIL